MRPLTRPLFPLAMALLLGGCAALPSGDAIVTSSGEWLSRTGEAIGAQRERLADRFSRDDDDLAAQEAEVEALLAQPWIDPLTDFLEANAGEPRLAESLVVLSRERDRRCAAIAEEYAERPANRETLARYRRGYLHSCPADVNTFHARVREEEARLAAVSTPAPEPREDESESRREAQAMARRDASDCYLYFTIRNLQQAREACAAPAEQGDARAQHHMGSLAELAGEREEALGWLQRAADGGDEAAAARLEQLSRAGGDETAEAAR